MNSNCDQSSHKDDVDVVYASICNTINVSSEELIDDNRTVQRHNIAGWNDNVKRLHTAAREAYLLWIYSGEPRHGIMFECMTQARRRFKYALRKCNKKKRYNC